MSGRGATRRRRLAAALGVGTAVVVMGSGAAAHATTVRAVTIDCAGDVITGHAQIDDPSEPTAAVILYGRRSGTKVKLATTTVALRRNLSEISYQFTLARHDDSYQVTVRDGRSAGYSEEIDDSTCAPPAEVPEAGVALAVPAAMGLAGAVWWLRRRRTATGRGRPAVR